MAQVNQKGHHSDTGKGVPLLDTLRAEKYKQKASKTGATQNREMS